MSKKDSSIFEASAGFFFFNSLEVWLIYNVLLASGAQQSDSVTHIHIYSFLNISRNFKSA